MGKPNIRKIGIERIFVSEAPPKSLGHTRAIRQKVDMTPLKLPETRADAENFDANDPLAAMRNRFNIPDGLIYLVGHSLGPATFSALQSVQSTAELEWAVDIVGSWNSADWINLPKTVGAKIAPLIGAKSHEVVICDSVSVNLFKLAASALPLTSQRRIIIEEDEFPTDQYIAQGLASLSATQFHRVSPDKSEAALLGGGVMIKSAVNYRTAELVNIAEWEEIGSKAGAIIVWDFSHATGIVPVDVTASGARLGAGCTYKYLNGGPGAPSFVYVREDIAPSVFSPLPGWLGHKTPFAFEKDYVPADNAARFVAGTPPILSLAALSGALDAFTGVEMATLSAKTQLLTACALFRAAEIGLETNSPMEATKRGGHISLLHDEGYAIVQALAAENIKADFRTPDTIRFGFSPLYLSLTEVWDVMDALEKIIDTRAWDKPEFNIQAEVT